MELTTERLLIREYRESDFENVHAYAGDSEVCRFMPWGPNDEAATKKYLGEVIADQRKEDRNSFELAICLRIDSNIVIGGVGMRLKCEANRIADLGFILRRPDWGRGIATEAAAALMKFGFERFDRHRIWATADVENIGSQRVLEKIGMQREGRLRGNTNLRGKYRDSYLYARLKTDE